MFQYNANISNNTNFVTGDTTDIILHNYRVFNALLYLDNHTHKQGTVVHLCVRGSVRLGNVG